MLLPWGSTHIIAAARHVESDVGHACDAVDVQQLALPPVGVECCSAHTRQIRGLLRHLLFERKYELLHSDRDFDCMEIHLGLRVVPTDMSVHEPKLPVYGAAR